MRYLVIETGGRVVFEGDELAEADPVCRNWRNAAFVLDCWDVEFLLRNDVKPTDDGDDGLRFVEDLPKHIEKVRTDVLFSTRDADCLPPEAEQHFLQGIAYLELAKCSFQLADYARMKNR